MRELFLLRGLPGSGKTTIARSLTSGGYPNGYYEADHFFIDIETGKYKFDPLQLPLAHDTCVYRVKEHMHSLTEDARIVVSNTFTQEWEMKPYLELAERYGFLVHTLIVENRHGGESVHDVPLEGIDRMESRFQIKLR
jgi:GTPase SAR1 family protein